MITQVHKFGGTCVKDYDTINKIVSIIEDLIISNRIYITVSASYGVTNKLKKFLESNYTVDSIQVFINELEEIHQKLIPHKEIGEMISDELIRLEKILLGQLFTEIKSDLTNNLILTFGERLIVKILQQFFVNAEILYPESFIHTDNNYNDAKIDIESTKLEFEKIKIKGQLFIIPGFYGLNNNKEICTLGRSGTDYTGSVVSAITEAESYTIWKDVDGFMSYDPNKLNTAGTIPQLHYDEAEELSFFGATLLHKQTISSLKKHNIPLIIKNIHTEKSTLINATKNFGVKSISYISNVNLFEISRMNNENYNLLFKIINQIDDQKISYLALNSTFTTVSFLIDANNFSSFYRIIESYPHNIKRNVSLLAIVGNFEKNPKILTEFLNKINELNMENLQTIKGVNDRIIYFVIDNQYLEILGKALHNIAFPII